VTAAKDSLLYLIGFGYQPYMDYPFPGVRFTIYVHDSLVAKQKTIEKIQPFS